MNKLIYVYLFFSVSFLNAQITPEIYSWQQNPNNITGYNGIPADVQQVFFSDNYSYVKCTGIPSYTIGPWAMNPNIPTNQNWTFKITRFPIPDPTPSTAGNGQIGVLKNGVVLFNYGDAMSYNNQNIWHRVAQYFEGPSFDSSGGHPAPGGVYHYHINMKYLYTPIPSEHSPILGYMFDGYPLYGPYGFSDTNGTGGISRMLSGYVKRNITARTTLLDGTVLNQNQWGPNVSTQYPLGCFKEDYELNTNGADLDLHNGRFCITPEYPNGTYAYFITIDSLGTPIYPYIIGNTYYGEVVQGNIPPGGHVTITEPVTQFTPLSISNNNASNNNAESFILYQNYPNPFNPETNIKFDILKTEFTTLKIYDTNGRETDILMNENLTPGSYVVKFNAADHPSGIYYFKLSSGKLESVKRMMLIK